MGVTRRDAIIAAGAVGVGAVLPAAVRGVGTEPLQPETAGASADSSRPLRANIKQSVARWCYEDIELAELCRASRDMGLPAIDLLEVDEWPVAHDHGLVVSVGMVGAGTIENGLNEPSNHGTIIDAFERHIPVAARAGVPNVICFFGNRRGMENGRAIENSVRCLERCAPIAEEHGVTILVEVLNSKVSHPDYIGDRTAYGVEVIEAVASPRVKILYDIYHMQVMEGDVIRTIRDNHQHIAHYHTGGVPGRGEIDLSQELNYVAITKAIVDTGFDGYVAHEFVPKGPDPLGSLRAAVRLCDV